ncbi:MAG TPA: TetR/AcrR family transcriptional regulator [Methanobacterium sp.]|nr:TetR/AcrR family transcriptional regulator [Methanobacterium sp.]
MAHGTKEKIMDAALIEFAEHGYASAKTKIIAEKSGLSEMTLFRRFETKRNLFNQVLKKNHQNLVEDFNSIMNEREIENPEDFFKTMIKLLLNLTEDNFEFISIIIYEREAISGDIIADLMEHLRKVMDKIFPDSKVDSKVFVFNILSFIYLIILDKRQGRTFVNHEEAIEKFINYSNVCLQ